MPVDYETKCEVCGHPMAETPRIWGCGHCCPADAPEVPSRNPKRYWKGGRFYPLGVDHVVVIPTIWVDGPVHAHAEIVHANGEGYSA